MTTQKHTPGPWCLGDYQSKIKQEAVKSTEVYSDITKAHVASMQVGSGTNIAQVQANARLIAAAPELLEATKDALESILSFYKASPKEAGEYFGAALCERLKESIAKAEVRP